LSIGRVTHRCTVINISLDGALVTTIPNVAINLKLWLSLSVFTLTLAESIEAETTVRWIDANGVGLQFGGLRARESGHSTSSSSS